MTETTQKNRFSPLVTQFSQSVDQLEARIINGRFRKIFCLRKIIDTLSWSRASFKGRLAKNPQKDPVKLSYRALVTELLAIVEDRFRVIGAPPSELGKATDSFKNLVLRQIL